jgi:hypothetical protein
MLGMQLFSKPCVYALCKRALNYTYYVLLSQMCVWCVTDCTSCIEGSYTASDQRRYICYQSIQVDYYVMYTAINLTRHSDCSVTSTSQAMHFGSVVCLYCSDLHCVWLQVKVLYAKLQTICYNTLHNYLAVCAQISRLQCTAVGNTAVL